MSFNYKFVIDFANEINKNERIKVLDFGCGPGNVVQMGIASGLDIYGVDIFQGLSYKEEAKKGGLFGTRIFEISDSKIYFPDNYFNVIIANQVFEHVEYLEPVLQEITRVLKPGGYLLSLFPTIQTWMEVHSKIPFVHKIKNRNLQLRYLVFMERLLKRDDNENRSPQKKAADFLNWMERNCFYRSISEIDELMSKDYEVSHILDKYLRARLDDSGKTFFSKTIKFFPFNCFSSFIFQKLGGFVVLSTKKISTE